MGDAADLSGPRGSGKVWLVGAGPGDPDLISVRGAELLARADAVLHDALSHPALLELCRADAVVIDVGKRPGQRYPAQGEITERLVALARQGKRVVRLKGGDPFMFARGAEEARGLVDAGVEFEVVPGVSSPVAASAFAGISLTERDISSSVTFITGSDREGKEWSPEAWQRLATATDTICIIMGMRRLREIARALVEGGRAPATPSAVIERGAQPEQRVVVGTLATIADEAERVGASSPAVVVVGEVVRLRETLAWYDKKPLFGKRILVPRAGHQGAETAGAVRARGALPVLFPLIAIAAPPDLEPLHGAIRTLASYDWVLFTSANGVTRFFAALARSGLDTRALGSTRVGAIGPRTAQALAPFGIVPDVTAEEYVGEALAAAIPNPKRVLLPRALVAREDLPALLRARGAEVDVVAAYETRSLASERGPLLRRELERGAIDIVLLTSSSTATSFLDAAGESARRTMLASIGPITSRAIEARGLRAAVTASVYTVEGLLDAVERAASQ